MNIFLCTFDVYLIMDHTVDCKSFYFNYVWNQYMVINKSEWLLVYLKNKNRLDQAAFLKLF